MTIIVATVSWSSLAPVEHEPSASRSLTAENLRSSAESLLHTLFEGAGDLCGGLAQALSHPEDYFDKGLCVVQLKRVLRGLAFTRGTLCNISVSSDVPKAVIKSLRATLDGLETDVFQELGRARESA
jgi:hypothetical protein